MMSMCLLEEKEAKRGRKEGQYGSPYIRIAIEEQATKPSIEYNVGY
jgi:hypothetical protein